jgi:hypothetical protein
MKLFALAVLAAGLCADSVLSQEQQSGPGQSGAAKSLGTVKAISGTTLTLTTPTGDISVLVEDGARVLRIPPGQTDLKAAMPIALRDILPGDRILVRGKLAPDGKTVLASSIIAMKQQDIADKQGHEREEWQKHGAGGIVSNLDTGTGTITVTMPALGANKNLVIHVSKATVLRRYAPDSVKFDDAKPSSFDQIKAGDQLRARGTRSTDSSELSADEVVSGSFRNIAGTISSIDTAAGTISVTDLTTKKSVVVKITGESQLRKFPPQMAQRIAARLKGGPAEPPPGAARGTQGAPGMPGAREASGSRETNGPPPGAGRAPSGTGAPDLQQVISNLPATTLAELKKADAVMIVATAGTSSTGVTAITLLAGVEPILQASPSGQSILTPWSLNSSGDAPAQ